MGDSEQNPANPTNTNFQTRIWPRQTANFAPDDPPGRFAADIGIYCSHALDAGRNSVISCWQDAETPEARLLLIRPTETVWEKEIVLPRPGQSSVQGARTSLALNRRDNDSPWIAYFDLEAGAVKVARQDGKDWLLETVAEGLTGFAATGLSLAFAPDGVLHVCFLSDLGLFVSRRLGPGNWNGEPVDTAVTAGTDCALAFGADGSGHIAYFDPDHTVPDSDGKLQPQPALKYARQSGTGAWMIGVIDTGDDYAGEFTSLAVAGGVAHVSYWSNQGLKYARLDSATSKWSTEFVEQVNGVGLYNSISVDRNGLPHIGYFDSVNGHLKCARRRATQGWEIVIVDADPEVGGYASLALDEFNAAHIAYYDWQQHNLRVSLSNRPPRLPDFAVNAKVNHSGSGNLLVDPHDPLRKAVDPDGDSLIVTLQPVSGPQHGTVVIELDGKYTYTPNEGFSGEDSFQYQVCDVLNACMTATVKITVKVGQLEFVGNPVQPQKEFIQIPGPGAGGNRPIPQQGIATFNLQGAVPRASLTPMVRLEKEEGSQWKKAHFDEVPVNRELKFTPSREDLSPIQHRLVIFVPSSGVPGKYDYGISPKFSFRGDQDMTYTLSLE